MERSRLKNKRTKTLSEKKDGSSSSSSMNASSKKQCTVIGQIGKSSVLGKNDYIYVLL